MLRNRIRRPCRVESMFVVLILLLTVSTVFSQQKASENFQIVSSVMSTSGGLKSSTNFQVQSSTGQPTATGISQSEHFGIYSGFQPTAMEEFPEWVPCIRLSADNIDWGEVTIGRSSERILTIHNDGLGTLEISSMSCDNSVFSVPDETMSLGGLISGEVIITFEPIAEESYEGMLTLGCNDAEEPELEVHLYGVGIVGCPGGELGDVTGDASINVLDVLAVINEILGLVPLDEGGLCRADCKGDGSINILDALNIVNIILGIIPECPGDGLCKTIITPETIAFIKALQPYFQPEEFQRLMQLVKTVQVPTEYSLGHNYPNPFNPTTTISYALPGGERRTEDGGRTTSHHVSLRIYNILGQEVRTLLDKVQEPGYYTVTWYGKDNSGQVVASGVYFYRLSVDGPKDSGVHRTGQWSETKRMVLMR